MKTKAVLLSSLVALLLAGCVVQSIQPLFHKKDLIPYPALVGTWVQREDNREQGTWSFVANGPRYRLTHTDENGRRATFHVGAGRLGTNVFLDIAPDEPVPGTELNELMAVHLIPAHVFAKVVKRDDALVLQLMDLDWLMDHLKANPKALDHIWRRDDGDGDDQYPVLIASTEALQQFVARHAHDGKVFKNEIKLVEKRPAQ